MEIRDNLQVVRKCDKHVGYEVFIKEGYYKKDECPVCSLSMERGELEEKLDHRYYE